MPPSRDDFARWREDFVTQWVFGALEAGAITQEETWRNASWINGAASQGLLNELRNRADAYRALAELDYERVCEIMGDEPSDE